MLEPFFANPKRSIQLTINVFFNGKLTERMKEFLTDVLTKGHLSL